MATRVDSDTDRHLWLPRLIAAAALLGFVVPPAPAQISVTGGTVYTQNFDTLPSSGSATFSQFDSGTPTLPGVFAVRSTAGTSIAASDGASVTGANLFSFGTGSSTDRALGSIGGSLSPGGHFAYGVVFQNTGSQALNINVQYAGEQWRNNNASAQAVSFSYATQVSAPTSADLKAIIPTANNTDPTGYTAVNALDFASPVFGGTAGPVDGNAAGNRQAFNQDVAVGLAPNSYLILYWSDPDHSGNDHGLAIDDLRVAFTPVPEPVTVLGTAVCGLGMTRLARRGRRGGLPPAGGGVRIGA
ncbi:MAG: hypothetical protein U0871_12765 [Gemmataceae bacterium]